MIYYFCLKELNRYTDLDSICDLSFMGDDAVISKKKLTKLFSCSLTEVQCIQASLE